MRTLSGHALWHQLRYVEISVVNDDDDDDDDVHDNKDDDNVIELQSE